MSALAISFAVSSYSFAQTTAPEKKVTLESLLAQTLEATKESQEIFDEQVADGVVSNDEFAPNIAFAPAIDISYDEVIQNLDENIGLSVRWGGQVIESTKINNSTVRLMVFAYPLSDEGRPLKTQSKQNQKSGRFVVDLIDGFAQNIDFRGRFLTFYGGISSKLTISNGKRNKGIPVIKAQEFVDWNMVDLNRNIASDQQRNSYYYLGFKTDGSGYSSRFYSPYYSSNRFGYGFSGVRSLSSRDLRSRNFRSRNFSRNGFSRSFSNRGFRNSRSFRSSRGFSRGFSSRRFRHH